VQAEFAELITETVQPLMKAHGYLKDGLTFWRTANRLVYIVNFQKDKYNSGGHFAFCVNCGIYSAAYARVLGRDALPKPRATECQVRYRIEEIPGAAYQWYRMEEWSDTDLCEALTSGLAKLERFFDKITRVEDMIPLASWNLPKDTETIAAAMAIQAD